MTYKCGRNWPCISVSVLCFAVLVFNFLVSCFILHLGHNGVLHIGQTSAQFRGVLRGKELSASAIKTLAGNDLHVSGHGGVFLHGSASSSLQLGPTLLIRTPRVSIVNGRGETIFGGQPGVVSTSARTFNVHGKAEFDKGVKTAVIDSFALEGLRIRSPISSVEIEGRRELKISSASGNIKVENGRNITLQGNKINFIGKQVYWNGASTSSSSSSSSSDAALALCLCSDGKVFADRNCENNHECFIK